MRSSCIVMQGLPLPLFSSFFVMINTSNIISFFLIFQIAFECILLQNDVISHYFLLNWKNRHTHMARWYFLEDNQMFSFSSKRHTICETILSTKSKCRAISSLHFDFLWTGTFLGHGHVLVPAILTYMLF